VLCAVGLGSDLAAARREAYALTASIHWAGVHYRHDIGHRALASGPGA
jgi:phosphoribosylamine---glycine ligase